MNRIRRILFPLGWMYGGIVRLRNRFFEWGLLSSRSYDLPVICVGNLSVGGTGKTPLVEYLIRLLQDDFHVATLSRGYRRKTTGYYELQGDEEALETGDEPLQFKTKYPRVTVAVDENRQEGIAKLKALRPPVEVILLDDAYQHRKVKPGFSILLTAYGSLYAQDLMLPAGNLREPKSGARRADIVVVTKCPPDLSKEEQKAIEQKLKLQSEQSLYFSFIAYSEGVRNTVKEIKVLDLPSDFALVTGIAKPQPLVRHLKKLDLGFRHYDFRDHHNFTDHEISQLQKEKFIVTTEKDFMRLKTKISHEKLFYLTIQQQFIEGKENFDKKVLKYVKTF